MSGQLRRKNVRALRIYELIPWTNVDTPHVLVHTRNHAKVSGIIQRAEVILDPPTHSPLVLMFGDACKVLSLVLLGGRGHGTN